MRIMRMPLECDQDDEERLVYEASFQECREYLRNLDSSEFDLYPDEDELSDESEMVWEESEIEEFAYV